MILLKPFSNIFAIHEQIQRKAANMHVKNFHLRCHPTRQVSHQMNVFPKLI